MSDRKQVSRKKKTASNFSNPSLAANIPSSATPTRSFGVESNHTTPQTVQLKTSEKQELTVEQQENQENISLKESAKGLAFDSTNYLQNVSFRPRHRAHPQTIDVLEVQRESIQRQELEDGKEEQKENSEVIQAKLNVSEPGDKQEGVSIWNQVFQIQRSEDSKLDKPIESFNILEKATIFRPQETVQRQEESEKEEQEVDGVIQAKCSECEREEQEEGELVQAKLTVGEPGDKYEQEADAVAAKVVEQINSPSSEQTVQGKVEPVVTQVMRQGGVGGGTVNQDVEQNIQQARGSGQGLADNVREPMEQAFGADFSGVKVHTSGQADVLNRSLNARAFTTGQDIFFKQGEYQPGSKQGQELLAHELTHVVQQTNSKPISAKFEFQEKSDHNQTDNPIQMKLADREKSGHGKNAQNRLKQQIDEEVDTDRRREAQDPERRAEVMEVNPREKARKKQEMKSPATPEINQSAIEVPRTQEAKAESEQKIDNPVQLVEEKEAAEVSTEDAVSEQASKVEITQQLAQNALTEAQSISNPDTPIPVEAPQAFEALDAQGNPLPPDLEGDRQLFEAARRVQEVRNKGMQLQAKAVEEEKKAALMQGKMRLVKNKISESKANLDQLEEGLRVRKDTLNQAEEAFTVAEDKQKVVAEQTPQYKEKIDQEKDEAAEVAQEGQNISQESQSNKPRDAEDREDAQQVSGKLNEVSQSGSRVDETYQRLDQDTSVLMERNTEAAAKNSDSQAKITQSKQHLDQAEQKTAELRAVNQEANTQIEAREQEPQESKQQALDVKRQGEGMVEDSMMLEQRLLQAQEQYRNDLSSVPTVEVQENPGGDTEVIQRQAEGDYSNRIDIFRDTFLDPATYKSVEEREQAAQQAQAARQREINYINSFSDKSFNDYTAGERILAGLGAKWNRFTRWISQLNLADVGKGVLNALNPLNFVLGIGSGLGMIINGAVNLFVDIFQGDIWGILKSLADIATGVAVVAGTITALSMAICAAMTALIIITWGAAAGFALPVMAFMGKVMSFMGPIAIWSGLTAAALNFIAGIKSVVDMGSAESAEQLQAETDDLQQDATGVVTGLGMAATGYAGKVLGPEMLLTGQATAVSVAITNPLTVTGIIAQEAAASLLGALTLKNLRGWFKNLRERRGTGLEAPSSDRRSPLTPDRRDANRRSNNRRQDDTDSPVTGTGAGRREVYSRRLSDGRRIRYFEDGRIKICASPCDDVRIKYQDTLRRHGDLDKRLQEIEDLFNTNPHKASQELGELQYDLVHRELKDLGVGDVDRDLIAHGGWNARKTYRRMIHQANYSDHGRKHYKAFGGSSDVDTNARTMSSGGGNAQYIFPHNRVKSLERQALLEGVLVPQGGSTFYRFYKYDFIVGYDGGTATRIIRAEFSSNNVHSHPISPARLRSQYGITFD
ncbi:DUF4157 domain-containing protein [Calothrix rhizosoleniae]|uniref:eCIS core domain-containing protein n=1 Tax=Calothrix rhizosoleniae TaxID=888997 RepID=UPI000B4A1E40|nr:DUF4157 domain-containing protein [Calothrix rhizosoleniae]